MNRHYLPHALRVAVPLMRAFYLVLGVSFLSTCAEAVAQDPPVSPPDITTVTVECPACPAIEICPEAPACPLPCVPPPAPDEVSAAVQKALDALNAAEKPLGPSKE